MKGAEDDRVFGNTVYTAGTFSNGDYYHIDVNGKDGKPFLIKDLGMIGADKLHTILQFFDLGS